MKFSLHSRVGMSKCKKKIDAIHLHSRVECKILCTLRVETSPDRFELRLDGRVDMVQIRQIRQEMGKLRSPGHFSFKF